MGLPGKDSNPNSTMEQSPSYSSTNSWCALTSSMEKKLDHKTFNPSTVMSNSKFATSSRNPTQTQKGKVHLNKTRAIPKGASFNSNFKCKPILPNNMEIFCDERLIKTCSNDKSKSTNLNSDAPKVPVSLISLSIDNPVLTVNGSDTQNNTNLKVSSDTCKSTKPNPSSESHVNSSVCNVSTSSEVKTTSNNLNSLVFPCVSVQGKTMAICPLKINVPGKAPTNKIVAFPVNNKDSHNTSEPSDTNEGKANSLGNIESSSGSIQTNVLGTTLSGSIQTDVQGTTQSRTIQLGSIQSDVLGQTQIGKMQSGVLAQTQLGSMQTGVLGQPQLGSVVTGVMGQSQLGSIQTGFLGHTQLGSLQSGVLGQTQLGSIQQGVLGQTQLGSIQTGVLGQTQLGSIQPGVFGQTQLGSIQTGVLGQTQLGSIQTGVLGQPQLVSIQPSVFGQPQLGSIQTGVLGQTQLRSIQSDVLGQTQIGSIQPGVLGQTQFGTIQTGALGQTQLGLIQTGVLGQLQSGSIQSGVLGQTQLGSIQTGVLGQPQLVSIQTGVLGQSQLGSIQTDVFGQTELASKQTGEHVQGSTQKGSKQTIVQGSTQIGPKQTIVQGSTRIGSKQTIVQGSTQIGSKQTDVQESTLEKLQSSVIQNKSKEKKVKDTVQSLLMEAHTLGSDKSSYIHVGIPGSDPALSVAIQSWIPSNVVQKGNQTHFMKSPNLGSCQSRIVHTGNPCNTGQSGIQSPTPLYTIQPSVQGPTALNTIQQSVQGPTALNTIQHSVQVSTPLNTKQSQTIAAPSLLNSGQAKYVGSVPSSSVQKDVNGPATLCSIQTDKLLNIIRGPLASQILPSTNKIPPKDGNQPQLETENSSELALPLKITSVMGSAQHLYEPSIVKSNADTDIHVLLPTSVTSPYKSTVRCESRLGVCQAIGSPEKGSGLNTGTLQPTTDQCSNATEYLNSVNKMKILDNLPPSEALKVALSGEMLQINDVKVEETDDLHSVRNRPATKDTRNIEKSQLNEHKLKGANTLPTDKNLFQTENQYADDLDSVGNRPAKGDTRNIEKSKISGYNLKGTEALPTDKNLFCTENQCAENIDEDHDKSNRSAPYPVLIIPNKNISSSGSDIDKVSDENRNNVCVLDINQTDKLNSSVNGQSKGMAEAVIKIEVEEDDVLQNGDIPAECESVVKTGSSTPEQVNTVDYVIDDFQRKPRNCSFKQAAVTRFSLKSDDIQADTDAADLSDAKRVTETPDPIAIKIESDSPKKGIFVSRADMLMQVELLEPKEKAFLKVFLETFLKSRQNATALKDQVIGSRSTSLSRKTKNLLQNLCQKQSTHEREQFLMVLNEHIMQHTIQLVESTSLGRKNYKNMTTKQISKPVFDTDRVKRRRCNESGVSELDVSRPNDKQNSKNVTSDIITKNASRSKTATIVYNKKKSKRIHNRIMNAEKFETVHANLNKRCKGQTGRAISNRRHKKPPFQHPMPTSGTDIKCKPCVVVLKRLPNSLLATKSLSAGSKELKDFKENTKQFIVQAPYINVTKESFTDYMKKKRVRKQEGNPKQKRKIPIDRIGKYLKKEKGHLRKPEESPKQNIELPIKPPYVCKAPEQHEEGIAEYLKRRRVRGSTQKTNTLNVLYDEIEKGSVDVQNMHASKQLHTFMSQNETIVSLEEDGTLLINTANRSVEERESTKDAKYLNSELKESQSVASTTNDVLGPDKKRIDKEPTCTDDSPIYIPNSRNKKDSNTRTSKRKSSEICKESESKENSKKVKLCEERNSEASTKLTNKNSEKSTKLTNNNNDNFSAIVNNSSLIYTGANALKIGSLRNKLQQTIKLLNTQRNPKINLQE